MKNWKLETRFPAWFLFYHFPAIGKDIPHTLPLKYVMFLKIAEQDPIGNLIEFHTKKTHACLDLPLT